MKKILLSAMLSMLLVLALFCAACDGGATAVEDYFTFDVSSISESMLKGESQTLSPIMKNLGETVKSPNYKTDITLEGNDVTADVYSKETKKFTPTEEGEYTVKFIALTSDGEIASDSKGNTFSKSIVIDVSILSFEAKNSEGVDVSEQSTEEQAKIVFGQSYGTETGKQDSGQYRLTGLTFDSDFFITYKLVFGEFNSQYSDPALYFGFDRVDTDKSDDCFKISTGSGYMATWIFDGTNLADLSSNFGNGWNFAVWYNTNNSVSGGVVAGEHTVTFERRSNADNTQAVYVLLWDGVPFTYLNVHDNFTAKLSALWVESVNTAVTISVDSYGILNKDTQIPTIEATIEDEYYGDAMFSLASVVNVTDDNQNFSLVKPNYCVTNKAGNAVPCTNGEFCATENETYSVEVSVEDFSGNKATKTFTIKFVERNPGLPRISLNETAAETVPGIGMKIYCEATDADDGNLYGSDKLNIKIFSGEMDVTNSVFSTYTDDLDIKHYVFLPTEAGSYRIVAEIENSKGQKDATTKEVTVSASYADAVSIYGWNVYDIQKGADKIILARDSIVYKSGIDYETAKIAPANLSTYTNWTLSYDVTGLVYSKQGKLNVTLLCMNDEGQSGWEDLAIGGNVNNDLWGFEAKTFGSDWIGYEWRSVWQAPVTTEFMPDPTNNLVGCGREGSNYTQYATGTHNYKIVCSTDGDGHVTYRYYIDGELEVMHRLPAAHDGFNKTNFIQLQSQNMSGTVTNLNITAGDSSTPIVNLESTAYRTVKGLGTEIYVTATDKDGASLTNAAYEAIKIYDSEGNDVTESVYSTYTDAAGKVHHLFTAAADGKFILKCEVFDSNGKGSATHSIVVSDGAGVIYGWIVDDISNGVGGIIVSREGLVFKEGINYDTSKMRLASVGDSNLQNWTLSYDVTGLVYSQQGKLNATIQVKNGDGVAQWEDIAIGGKPNNDLWGFEANTYGSGWITYQWRSNWDNKTTEFMPDPTDATKGCGRGASAYAQYGTGTHNYKIVCSTDEDGNVTYTFYIDDEIEVVHHLPDVHDGYNIINFLQFQAQSMSGVVSNISVSVTE